MAGDRCCTHAAVAAADVEGAAAGELPVDGVQDGGRRQLLDEGVIEFRGMTAVVAVAGTRVE